MFESNLDSPGKTNRNGCETKNGTLNAGVWPTRCRTQRRQQSCTYVCMEEWPTAVPTTFAPTDAGETYAPSITPSGAPTRPTASPTKVPTATPTIAPTAAVVVSSSVVLNNVDPDTFNNDTAAQSSLKISLTSSIESVTSEDQVINMKAENGSSTRRAGGTSVTFDLVIPPTAGEDSGQLQANLVSQLTSAVSSGDLTAAIVANAPANSSLSAASVNEAASTTQIETTTVVTTQSPTTAAPTTQSPTTEAPSTAPTILVPPGCQNLVTILDQLRISPEMVYSKLSTVIADIGSFSDFTDEFSSGSVKIDLSGVIDFGAIRAEIQGDLMSMGHLSFEADIRHGFIECIFSLDPSLKNFSFTSSQLGLDISNENITIDANEDFASQKPGAGTPELGNLAGSHWMDSGPNTFTYQGTEFIVESFGQQSDMVITYMENGEEIVVTVPYLTEWYYGTTGVKVMNHGSMAVSLKPDTFAPTTSTLTASAPITSAPTTSVPTADTPAPTTSAPTDAYTLWISMTMVGVSIEDVSDANFLIALTNTISQVTAISTSRISLAVNSRRDASIQATIQSGTEAEVETASSAISEASSSGTINSKLSVQLASTSYSGSIPSSMTITVEVVTNSASEEEDGSDGVTLVVIIVVTSVGLLLIVASVMVYCLCCRQQASDDTIGKALSEPSTSEHNDDDTEPSTFLGAVEPDCLKNNLSSMLERDDEGQPAWDTPHAHLQDRMLGDQLYAAYAGRTDLTTSSEKRADDEDKINSDDNDRVLGDQLYAAYAGRSDQIVKSKKGANGDDEFISDDNDRMLGDQLYAAYVGRPDQIVKSEKCLQEHSADNAPNMVGDPGWFTKTISAVTTRDEGNGWMRAFNGTIESPEDEQLPLPLDSDATYSKAPA